MVKHLHTSHNFYRSVLFFFLGFYGTSHLFFYTVGLQEIVERGGEKCFKGPQARFESRPATSRAKASIHGSCLTIWPLRHWSTPLLVCFTVALVVPSDLQLLTTCIEIPHSSMGDSGCRVPQFYIQLLYGVNDYNIPVPCKLSFYASYNDNL